MLKHINKIEHILSWDKISGNPANRLFLLVFIFLLPQLTLRVYGQEPIKTDSVSVIETLDGNIYIGTIQMLNDSVIGISTSVGFLNIPKSKIKSITNPKKDQIVGDEYWPENPHSSRHFWAPSGYGLREGEGYYQNTWILLNQVSYGITDNFSIGGGIMPLFLFGLPDYTPVWLTPKVNVPYRNGKGAFGFGTIVLGILGEEGELVGILYGSNTFGTRDKQLTIGLGYGYSSDGGFASSPTISLSGMNRISKKWSLISENYLIGAGQDTTFGILSVGARYMGQRLAIDFGGILPLSVFDTFLLVPWLGITIPFK